MTPTIVRCGNYTYAAQHKDGLCESCGLRWTVAVYEGGKWLCMTCAGGREE